MKRLLTVLLTCFAAGLAGCGTTAGPDTGKDRDFEAAPKGTKWVGLGQVVVAVPDWWSVGETQCYAPVEDTIYFDSGAAGDCSDAPSPAEVREVSALAVLDSRSGHGEFLTRTMQPIAEVSGNDVVEAKECDDWFEGICRQLFAVPDEGVVFAVTLTEDGGATYEEIRDSVRILPEALTTVPLAVEAGWTPTWGAEPRDAQDLVKALKRAGLIVEIETADMSEPDSADLPKGSLLDVQPALGGIVDVGGTVTVTLAG